MNTYVHNMLTSNRGEVSSLEILKEIGQRGMIDTEKP